MPAVDDLPKMISLSPGPLTTMDVKDVSEKISPEKETPFRRHNLDAEVIEVLWQQDIDLGLTRHDFDPIRSFSEEDETAPLPEKVARLDDEWQPAGAPAAASSGAAAVDDSLDDIWAGLDYSIDSETGEYVLCLPAVSPAESAQQVPSSVDQLNSAVDALDEPALCGPIPTTIDDLISAQSRPMPTTEVPLQRRLASCDSGQGSLGDADCSAEQIALLDQMIEAAQNHTIASQPRQPLVRMVSMEQRWQDLASVLLLPGQQPPPVPPTATLAPPSGPLTQQADFHDSHGALGQTSPPASAPSGGATGGDLLYYQLSPVTPMAEPAPALPLDREEAFLSHLLDADDLDLDSAPITLAAEDWVGSQTGGDVQRPVSLPDHPQSSGSGLNGLGSFSRCPAPVGAGSGSDPPSHGRSPGLPVAQKKHQMYGRRVFTGNDGLYRGPSPASTTSVSPAPVSSAPASPGRYAAEGGLQAAYPPANTPTPGEAATDCEPDEIKFSRSAQFTKSPAERLGPVAHNHSYQQPALAEGPSEAQRPIARDKSGERKGERLSRDDRRTRAMNIPLSAEDIVHLPMDEFNERLARHQLTEAQLSLVRDVRRRGKNKLAAQNCRKRKLDQIAALTEDLKKVRDQRQRTLSEHQFLTEERSRIRDKYARMHRHVFQSLRDADGRPYSPADFSLQMSADGNVLLVARSAARGAVIVADPAVGAGRSRSQ